MGKWSANGIDEVLAGKIATVIDSVNARIKLDAENETERAAPPAITYEQFVDELDLGDSFTSCLFEALVKEMAERRTRSQQAEKRMISRKTQKMLANLYDQTRVLKDERAARRPSVRGAFYASQFPGLDWGEDDLTAGGAMDTAEDDVSAANDPLLDPETLSEAAAGARRAAEQLYESYYSRPLRQIPSFARIPGATDRGASSSLADDVWGLERIFRASGGGSGSGSGSGGNTQTANTASGAGVGRQPSIRRTARSRAVDFTDFATRRRQSTRAAEAEAAAQRADEPTPSSSTAAAPASAPRFGEAPWNASGFGLANSAARALSSSSRLRRAAGGLPPEAFLLRSVSPPPAAFYAREASRAPSADPAPWLFDFSSGGGDGEERAHTAEPQMLTPRSSTPDEGAPARTGSGGAPVQPSSAASVAGSSQVPASP